MRRLHAIMLLGVTLTSAVALAQQSTDGSYILHEYFDRLDLTSSNGESGDAEPGAQRDQLFQPGEPPALSLETRPGEPIYDKDGPVFDVPIDEPYGPLSPYAGANTLDDRTDRVDSLTYFANFDPSIIPYKRVVVKNHAVRRPNGDYSLEVGTGERRPVELAAMPDEPADVFWGTFLLRVEAGRLHPIASISPDQRILQIATEPDVALDVERDDADNFFVRSAQEGLVRLNMQIAVPKFYFGGPFPDIDWADFPTDRVPPLDPGLRAHALAIAQKIGFDRTQRPAQAIVKMVGYFRDFDARPFPDSMKSNDLLDAISTNAIGVCRHRSLAFVFLAQAMGIPTRYVYNEAHAFVEVFWPGAGWRRLDLGGAADELTASANEGRSVHDPGNDGLPTPPHFVEEQQRMAHNGWEPPESAGGDERSSRGENNTTAATPTPAGHDTTNGAVVAGTHGAEPTDAQPPKPGDEPKFVEPPPDERVVTKLRIIQATAVVRRGGEIRVEAQLTSATREPIRGREVEIYLGPVGSTRTGGARLLGRAVTGQDGRIRTHVQIPREHAIGRWSLFVRFAGDTDFQPVVAE